MLKISLRFKNSQTSRANNSSTYFFNKQPVCSGYNVKNGLKIKQLAKQPPTLKMLLRK